jgi:hypothetical protein
MVVAVEQYKDGTTVSGPKRKQDKPGHWPDGHQFIADERTAVLFPTTEQASVTGRLWRNS